MGTYLIVSPSFPPDKTVATIRMSSFVKYLQNKNLRIIILTNKKTGELELISSDIKYIFVDGIDSKPGFSAFKYNSHVYCEAAKRIFKTYNVDCVLISMGPFYTNKISIIAKQYGIRSILDYRDPWTFDFREDTSKLSIKKCATFVIKCFIEERTILSAFAVTTVTPGWIKIFKRMHPFQKEKFVLIENGYDDAKLNALNLSTIAEKNNNKVVIGVFGKLFYYTDKYSSVFLEAMSKIDYSKYIIFQIGEKEQNADKLINELGIPNSLIYSTGFVDYSDGIIKLNKADIFLIIDARKYAIGTKIYDYIYLRKPIIYVGPKNSEIAKLVKQINNCYVCSTVNETVFALQNIANGRIDKCEYNRDFSRSAQNELLYNLLIKN